MISECAFCTFPDKPTAAAEAARVVRPAAGVGLTDVWLAPTRLDPDLAGLAGRIACIADARPIDDTRVLLESAGFASRPRRTPRRRPRRLPSSGFTTGCAPCDSDLPLLRSFDVRRAVDVAGRVKARSSSGVTPATSLLTATKGG